MTIAFDIDDTITRHPGFFSFLTGALIDAGHRVIIITFRDDRESAMESLEEMGVRYTELVTSSREEHEEFGLFEWKGEVCRRHGVEVFFEDDAAVLQYVDPSIVSLMVVDHEQHDLSRTRRELW
ncbi:MAG: HAD family hydrolase [Phycisphaerales bacterium]|nr:HAD family hydrolase [Phycisphaerales bacterium]